jgi:gliding motility-associated-like protein
LNYCDLAKPMSKKTTFGSLHLFWIFVLIALSSGTAFAVVPRAHHVYISGTTAGANPATFAALRSTNVIRVWYTYKDNDGSTGAQAENTTATGTVIAFFQYDDEFGTNPVQLQSGSSVVLLIPATAIGKYLGVRVTVKNNGGEVGPTIEYKAFSPTNKNRVLANGAPACGKAGGGTVSQGNNLDATAPLCSPRNAGWEISYTGIDFNNANAPKVLINWNDGGGYQTYTPTLVNPLLTANDTINLTNSPAMLWRTTQIHNFSYATTGGTSAASTTLNQVCTYNMQATWGNGTTSCAASAPGNVQTAPFSVWDKENNTSLGTFDINHTPGTGGVETGEITDICVGDRTAIRVQDASDFNCTKLGSGPVETVTENKEGRWIQFVYGTTGSTVTTGPGATENVTINGVDYTFAQLPVYGRVTYQANPNDVPLPAVTDDIQMPTSGTANQILMVTLRSWNTCNMLDRNGTAYAPTQGGAFNVQDITHVTAGAGSTQPGLYAAAQFNKPVNTAVFANATAVERTYTLRLKTKPLPPTYSPINYCEIAGSAPPAVPVTADFNITFGNPNGAGTFTLDVYPTPALAAASKFTDASAPFTFNPVNQGPAANQIDVTPPPANPNIYHKYATLTGSNNCVSDPLDVEIRIQAVKTPGVVTHALGGTPKSICTGTDPVAFTVTNSGGGNNILGDDIYQWQQSIDGGTTWTDIAAGSGGTVAAYDPPALTATTQFRRRVRESWFDITGSCDEATSNVFIFVVDTAVAPGVIGNPQTVCAGVTNPAAFTSPTAGSGGNGTPTYTWQISIDNFGADINTIGGANAATYDPPAAVSVDTYYRRVNTSGSCSPAFANSNIIKLTVEQAIVPGTITSDQIICSGQTPTGLTGPASTGGSGVYTYAWERSTTSATTGFATIGGATLTTFAPGALTATTWYRRLTTAGVCAAQYSNVVEVTVNPLPTVVSVTGGGAVCSGNPAPDITFTFTGVLNLNFVIRQTKISDGTFVDVPVNNHNALTYTIVDPTPTFDTKYQIFSLADNNLCNATTLGGSVNVTIGGSAPNFDTMPSLAATAVCFVTGGSPDPSLNFSIDVNTAGTYTLVYKADGSTNRTKTFSVNGAGDPTAAITFNDTAFDPIAPSPHVLRIVSITTPAGCQSIFNTDLNFTVNPLPAGANKSLTAVCSPGAVSIDIAATSMTIAAGGNNVASTFAWTANYNGLTGMATTGTTSTITGTLTNPGNTVLNAVFTITPKSTATPACTGSTFTITLPINPLPTIFDRTAEICSGNSFSITPSNANPAATTIVPAGTTYTWTITPNANITGASNQGTAQGAIGQTLTNITEVPQTIRYTVTPKAGAAVGACVGATFFVDVTVDPTPKIADIPTAACSGSAFSVTPANAAPTTIVPANTTYSWGAPSVTGGVTGGSAATNQTSIGQTLTNASTSQQTATYTVTPKSGAQGTCTGPTFKVIVTVNPIPKLNSTLTPAGICTGTFNYTPTSLTAGATFAWSRPNIPGINESASSGNGNISETLTNPTTLPVDVTYTIITTANTCSNTGQDVVVRVNPTPLANPVVGPANVCVGTNPFFYSVTQRSGSTYSWEIPASFTVEAAGGGVVAGGGPGAFTSDYFILLKFSTPTPPSGFPIKVIEKSGDGCIGSINTLTVVAANSPPTVPIGGGNVFCKGEHGVVFSVPQNSSSTFTWSTSSGAVIDGPSAGTNTYFIIVDFDNNIPTAQIDVTETNVTGCPANYPSLVVSLLDEPKFTGLTATICSGEQPSSQYDLDAHIDVPSNFAWVVTKVTGTVTGVNLNDVGSGPLEHLPTIKNTSGADAVIEYTVTATGSAPPNCKSAATVVKITVKPEPIVNSIADQIFCPNVLVTGATSFPLSSNVSGATMNWTSSNPAIGLVAASGTGNISFTSAENLGGTDIVSNITVSATSNGCVSNGSNTKTFKITIKPRPVVASIIDIVVCPGDNITVPNFSSNTAGGETYAWTNDNTTVGLGGSGSGNISSFFASANNTGSDKVANISVVSTRLSCAGPARTFKITVRPQPVVNTITNASFCAGDVINIPLTSNVAGATINWTNTNTAIGVLASGSGDITGTAPANNTGVDIVGTVTVTAVANACTSAGANTKTFTITIKATPIVNAVSDITVCSGGTTTAVTFGSNIATGVIYNWTNTNAAVNLASTGSGNIAAFTAATNLTGSPITAAVTVIGTRTGCSSPGVTFNITVNPEPVVTTVSAQQFCPGDAVSIPLASNVAGATINWTNSNTAVGLLASGTGSIAFTAPANNTGANIDATIVVTAAKAGCTSAGTNSKTFTIRIKPTPIVSTITDITVCSGEPISTVVFTANTGGAETFNWTNSNTSIGILASGSGNITGYNAPVNTGGTAIVATISVSATLNSCAGPTKTFKITVNPEPVVTTVTNKEFCPTESVNIPFASNVVGANLTWTNSNPAIGIGASGSGDIVYVAPANNTGADIVGTITVTAANAGCASTGGNSKSFTITIKATPIVNSVTNITVCSGGTITVPSFGSNISSGVTFAWTNDETAIGLLASGNGNITAFAAAPNTTSSAIVATISVIGTRNLCSGSARTFTITVLPEPVGTNSDITVCSDVAVNVNLSTLITGGAAANKYNITITNSAGLSASAGSPVDGVNFTATEIQNDKWTNQTGASHDIVYHITPISGATPACPGATFDFTVHVNPEPIVTLVTNKTFCPTDPVNIPLLSNVTGANISWTNSNLAVGLASTGTGDIVYAAPANNTGVDIVATIVVSAELNGCTSAGTNRKTFTITIKPTPIVNTITDVSVCSGASISAINFTANTGGSETFNWTNDNTAIGLPIGASGNIGAYIAPINTSGIPIVATITVSATRNSCPGPTKTFKITVNPEPVVTLVTNKEFCPTESVNIPFASNVIGANITWTNSNSAIGLGASGSGDIVYVAPANNTGADIVGTITVTAANAGCASTGSNSKSFTITIKATPIVNSITNITVCSGSMITVPTFGSNITSGVTFAWTNDETAIGLLASGNGNITAFASAPNTTSSAIVATISVIGTKNLCSGSARTFTITVLPEPVGTNTDITICSDVAVGVNLSTLITGGAAANRYNITITNSAGLSASAGTPVDGTNLTAIEIQNDKWTNQTGVPHDIVYHITPISGGSPACTGATFDFTVHVNPEPIVTLVTNKIFCPTDPVNIPLLSNVSGANISWTNSNLAVGLASTGTGDIIYAAPANNTGVDIVATLVVSAELNGCTSAGANKKTFTITIKPTPIVDAITDVVACSGAPISAINFTANTGGSETFNWTNDNTAIGLPIGSSGNIGAYVAPINISGVPIVATITVSATRNSCPGPTRTFKITVNPEPVVTTITDKAFCPGESVSIPFASNVPGATITWTNDNTPIGIGVSGSGNIVYVAPGNSTGVDIIGNITVKASLNSCVSTGTNLKTFKITIKPTPIVNSITNVTVCSGGPISAITFGSNVVAGGVTFDWTNDNPSVNLGASGTGNIPAFTAGLNLTSTPIVATVSVTGTKNTCSGLARTFTITILPQPVGTSGAVTVCSDAAVAVNLNSMVSGSAAKYDITITNVAGLPASAGSPVNVVGASASEIQDDRWTNITGSQKDIVYHMIPTGPGSPGCVGNAFDLTVHVNPEPVVSAVINQEFCPGATVSIPLFSNVAGASITWANTNTVIGLGLNGSGDISFTAPANNTGADIVGTITVNASSSGCSSSGTNTKQFTITIKPTPIVDAITNVIVCSGTPISTINFTANTGGGETFSWTNNNTAIGIAATGNTNIPGYGAPTNFTGVPIVATIGVSAVRNSCPSPVRNFTITISPEPVVTPVSNQAFCAGETVNIPLASNVPGSTISWTNTNSSIGIGTAGGGNIVYTAPNNNTGVDIVGTIEVSATKDGCLSAGSNKKTFTITIKPTPIVNTIIDITVCSGQTINVPAFGSNVVAGGVTFNWTNTNTAINLGALGSGDIASFAAATNVSGVPMVADITFSGVKNTCAGPSKSFRITINPEPVVAAVIDHEYCPGAVVNIPLASNVSGALISWTNTNSTIGIGTSGTGDIIYTAPINTTGIDFVGTITVSAERNLCTSGPANQKTFQIRIKAAPVVATITPINVCSGDMVSAINFTSNADPGVTFDWTNDNTAINLLATGTGNIPAFASAVNTSGAPMIANVSVHGTKNGCTGIDMVFKITVFPEPVLGITPNAPMCSRGITNITLATNGTSIGAQGFRIDNIEYSSNGGPFSAIAPTLFTFPGTNKIAGAQANDPNIVKNDIYTNLSPFTVTVRYTITPFSVGNAASAAGCFGDPAQVVIDVNPEPDLDNTLSPAPICSGITVVAGNPGFLLKADPASVAATSFIINNIFPNGLTPGPSNATTGTGKPATAINNDSWINTGNTPVDVTYEITPVTGSCLGQKENVIVRVNPSPSVKDGLSRIVCDDANSNIVLQDDSPVSIAANSYVVTITVGGTPIAPGATVGGLTAAGTNYAGGTTTNVNAIRNDHFKNNTDDRIVVTYTIIPISAPAFNSCPGPAKQITLMVEPKVKSVSVNTTPTICSGDVVNITFASPSYANGDPTNPTVTFSYSTTASAIQGATVGNNLSEGDKITDLLVNTTNNPITVHYFITPRAAAAANGIGCAGNPEPVDVIVLPLPRINNLANKNVCEGVPVNLALSSSTTPVSGGSIKVFVTATADPEISGFSNGVLFNNSTSIVDALSNSASTTKQVTYHLEARNVDAGGVTICTAGTPIDVTVSVSPTPIIAPIADFAICSGTPFDPTTTIVSDTDPSLTSISWTVTPNGNVGGESNGAGEEFSQTLINNTSDKQTVIYAFKAINIANSPSCASGNTILNVTVYPNPKVVGLPRSMDVCNNGFLTPNPYVLTPSTVPALGATFDWTFDDGTNPQSVLTDQTGISQMFTNPDPFQSVQSFTIDAHLTIPAGANPKYGNTCVNQAPTSLLINVAPQVGGDIFTNDLDGNEVVDGYVCRGATSRVTLEPSGLQNFTVDYSITNTSGTTNLSYTGSGGKLLSSALTETTVYLLKRVTDKFNCHIDINKSVTVNVDAVDVGLTLDGVNPRCTPFDAQFRYNEVAGVEYTWHWGDGNDDAPVTAGSSTPGQAITHQFTSTSTNPAKTSDYKVTYEASLDPTKFLNGCRKTSAAVTVKVFPTVVPAVAVERNAYCSDDLVKLSNTTLGATTNHWYYVDQTAPGVILDESFDTSPVFQMINASTQNPAKYDIFYESDNGNCPGATQKITVDVYRGIDAHFVNTTPTIYMAGESDVTFTNDSNPVDAGFRYDWNFGADSNPLVKTTNDGVPIPVIYKHPGSKTITMSATNVAAETALVSCASEFTVTINIATPVLVAEFDMIPEKACFPSDIVVTANRSTGDTYEWTLFDNAGIASVANTKTPTFKVPSPGQYTVQLVTTNIFLDPSDPNYQKSVSKDVIIYDIPTAQFTLRPTTVFVPDTEMITYNISSGAKTYLWDFGDGETSEDKAPTHTYRIENVYDVTLVAYFDHEDGIVCSDTAVEKVTAKQGGITRVPNAFTPNPNGPAPVGSPGANSFNDVFLPQVKGAEEFNMQVFDRWGNLIFESNNSNIGWDGYTKEGKLLPAGVYVYKLTLRLSDGQRTTQVGDITMIR